MRLLSLLRDRLLCPIMKTKAVDPPLPTPVGKQVPVELELELWKFVVLDELIQDELNVFNWVDALADYDPLRFRRFR